MKSNNAELMFTDWKMTCFYFMAVIRIKFYRTVIITKLKRTMKGALMSVSGKV